MNEQGWKDAVVYQIYPKSFKDTTGDGIGDIQGIISKLDYLQELGVDILWLTPIYQSPQHDNGYDISDYYAIDGLYGTMEDFEQLLSKTHQQGMKLIMDLVINHTSTEHEWFKESARSTDNAYRDFYIWKNGVNGQEPNNWQSKFGGSAWEYDKRTNQYYLHLFDRTQADLNWENKTLRKKIYQMIGFWAEKGVDGFRLDVINLISKDQSFSDDDAGDGRVFYTDGPRIHEFLQELNREVLAPNQLITVGEMSSTTIDDCILYTNPTRNELNMTFQFHHLKVDYPNGNKWTKAPFDFLALKQILSEWQVGMHEGDGWNALFWCNHDQPRVVSRFGNDGIYHQQSAKMLATTLHMMQGTPYIYQGEELGMTNPNFTNITDYRDIETFNAFDSLKKEGKEEQEIIEILQQKSRDNARTPMQWSDEFAAGFSEGTPWIPVAENYQEINVEQALKNPDSIFYHYQQLIRLRKQYDVIKHGNFQLMYETHPSVFAYTRNWKNETLLVVSNFDQTETTIHFDLGKSKKLNVISSNYPDSTTAIDEILLRPYESIVYYGVFSNR